MMKFHGLLSVVLDLNMDFYLEFSLTGGFVGEVLYYLPLLQ